MYLNHLDYLLSKKGVSTDIHTLERSDTVQSLCPDVSESVLTSSSKHKKVTFAELPARFWGSIIAASAVQHFSPPKFGILRIPANLRQILGWVQAEL